MLEKLYDPLMLVKFLQYSCGDLVLGNYGIKLVKLGDGAIEF